MGKQGLVSLNTHTHSCSPLHLHLLHPTLALIPRQRLSLHLYNSSCLSSYCLDVYFGSGSR